MQNQIAYTRAILRSIGSIVGTLARLPVVLEHEAVGAQAEHPAHRGQTRVGTSGVVDAARARVPIALARVIVGGERRVSQALARALVSSHEISTGVLAGAVAVVQQTLVDVYTTGNVVRLIRRRLNHTNCSKTQRDIIN